MNLNDIPLFQMLKGRMGHLSQRQEVIAENVANANTPGYTPHDLKPFTFDASLQAARGMAPVAPSVTSAMHIAGKGPSPSQDQWKRMASPDSETTLDGNQVVLEEEMMKMTKARMDYEAAVGFYQKSLNLLRLAARAPGRG